MSFTNPTCVHTPTQALIGRYGLMPRRDASCVACYDEHFGVPRTVAPISCCMRAPACLKACMPACPRARVPCIPECLHAGMPDLPTWPDDACCIPAAVSLLHFRCYVACCLPACLPYPDGRLFARRATRLTLIKKSSASPGRSRNVPSARAVGSDGGPRRLTIAVDRLAPASRSII